MTPEQKIKHLIIAQDCKWQEKPIPDLNESNIDEYYDEMCERDEQWDALSEVRHGDFETNIPCADSRHYESKSVAAKALDGTWVGWTFWYGGGKHGEPEAIDWIEDAYDLNCIETEKTIIHREFTKKEAA